MYSLYFAIFMLTVSSVYSAVYEPLQCGLNEYFDCGSPCQTTCATLGEPCRINNVKCTKACYCKLGYARNDRGVCIPANRCPPKPPKIICTRPHEHYACGSACQDTCWNIGQECPIKNIKCNEACYCNRNYVRNKRGDCIHIRQCPREVEIYPTTIAPPPIVCLKPHEHYECGSACQTACATLGQTCPIINIRCNDACYCNEGYARDSSGTCIPIEECSKDKGKYKCKRFHEHWECGSACQTTCENLDKECDIVNITCNNGCYCDKGYARNKYGFCILISKCPKFRIDY